MPDYRHIPHPRIAERRQQGPPQVRDEHVGFNGRVAVMVTTVVGTMWCAYAFAVLALVVLPQATASPLLLVQWISQTFIQLVLLSVIMVGQSVQARAADKRSLQTYQDAEAILHECLELQRHLQAQDAILSKTVTTASPERSVAPDQPQLGTPPKRRGTRPGPRSSAGEQGS